MRTHTQSLLKPLLALCPVAWHTRTKAGGGRRKNVVDVLVPISVFKNTKDVKSESVVNYRQSEEVKEDSDS